MADIKTAVKYDIYDTGFDSFLSRLPSALAVEESLGLPSILKSNQQGTNPASVLSGCLTGNLIMAAGYLASSNFASGVSGWRITYDGDVEFNIGTFRGSLVAGSIHIPDENTTANSYHVDAEGNVWWGCHHEDFDDDNNNAVAYVLKTGAARFTSISITGGVIDGTTTIGGRLSSVLATAIDASGHFADSAISTATSTIIGAFTFGVSGALQIGTYVHDSSGDLRISQNGILARNDQGDTTFFLNGATGVISGNGLVVGTNVGLGTAQDGAGVTTIIGNTVTTDYVNALDITAVNLSAATGTFVGTVAAGAIIVGTNASTIELASQADFPPDTNLVTYWSFDEGSGTVANDGSGNNNPMTLVGATWASGGPAGGWINFDGSDDRGIWVNPLLGKTEFTISIWFYKDSYVQYQGLMSDYAPGYLNLIIGYENPENTFRFLVGDGTNVDSISVPGVTAGILHHLICRFDAANHLLDMFLDGVKATSSTDITNIGATSYPDGSRTSIGRYSTNYEFDGKIGPIRIYDKALTDAQCYALDKNPGQGKSLAVPVGRLTSGYIYSKQIQMAVTAGTGDSYIAFGGKTDFDATNAGAILGCDDSDSDKFKMYIVNSTTKYFYYDGADIKMRGGSIIAPEFQTAADGSNKIEIKSSVSTSAVKWSDTTDTTKAELEYDFADSIFKITNGNKILYWKNNAILRCLTTDGALGESSNYWASGYIDRIYSNYLFVEGTPDNNDGLKVSTYTPSSGSDANGAVGQICWDSSYIYVKTGSSTWKRAALSAF